MSENKENEKKEVVSQTNNDVMELFGQEFSSALIPIHINSLDRDVNFREVTVAEQKSLSKSMIQNESRKDIIYDTQCAMINQLCLEEGFSVYDLTEFDRIRILMETYSSNYIQNDITYKCPNCGKENVYRLDFNKILDRFNEFKLEDFNYQIEDKNRIYNFTLNYPSVRNVSGFYKNYMKKFKNTTKQEAEMLNNLGNIEYINLFIKEIQLTNKSNPEQKKVADLRMLTFDQVEQLLAMFPQSILFDDEKGVVKKITEEFIEKINKVFQYERCQFCDFQTEQGMGNLIDFF